MELRYGRMKGYPEFKMGVENLFPVGAIFVWFIGKGLRIFISMESI